MGTKKKRIFDKMWKARYFYLMLLPVLAFYIFVCYMPMSGLQLAFKEYWVKKGIWGSPLIGFQNFEILFRDPSFWRSIRNTLLVSVLRIAFQFPAPILVALMLNEVRNTRLKKTLQTVYTFPHFISWVIIAGLINIMFGADGCINGFLGLFGLPEQKILSDSVSFYPLVILSEIWKTTGWSSIIYLAAIAGISQEQYEAAEIDGASKLQKVMFVTLPSIKPTITIMFILACSNVMNAGFDQLFNLQNPAVARVAEILDLYIYRITFQSTTDFGFSTAVTLFKSIVNFTILITCDRVAKWSGGRGLYY